MLERIWIPAQAPHRSSARLPPRGRFTIYFAFIAATFISLVLILFLFLWIWESSLEESHAREWAEKSKQVRPYYTWESVSHDGMSLSDEQKGPLKLALHPLVIYTNLPGYQTSHFKINRMGFRGEEIEGIHGDKKRIVLLGGSTAFGTGLEQDGETFGNQLADLLNAEVINAAVIGHGSGQELTYLITNLVDLEPDLVLTLDGWNDYYKRKELQDLRLLGTNGFVQIEEQLLTLARQKHPSLLRRAANLPSLLFPRVSERLKHSRLGLRLGWKNQEAQWLPVEAAAETYAANIAKMSKMAHGFQYKFLCVIQPEVGSQEGYRQFRNAVKGHLHNNQVSFLDLEEAEQITDAMFLDTVHTDAIGHRIMAEIVAKRIIQANLLSDAQ